MQHEGTKETRREAEHGRTLPGLWLAACPGSALPDVRAEVIAMPDVKSILGKVDDIADGLRIAHDASFLDSQKTFVQVSLERMRGEVAAIRTDLAVMETTQ